MIAKKKTVKFLGVEYPLEKVLVPRRGHLDEHNVPIVVEQKVVGFEAMTSLDTDDRARAFEFFEGFGSDPQAAVSDLEETMIYEFRRAGKFLGYTVEG